MAIRNEGTVDVTRVSQWTQHAGCNQDKMAVNRLIEPRLGILKNGDSWLRICQTKKKLFTYLNFDKYIWQNKSVIYLSKLLTNMWQN